MNTIHYNSCPVCDSPDIMNVFSVKDHSVSREVFVIMECRVCNLRFTQDAPAETSIGRYYQSGEYISHSNTSKGFINGLYQRVRKRTLRQKQRLIEKVTGLEEGKLLDLGAGTGAFASQMNKAGWNVTALEPDAGARIVAKDQFDIELRDTNTFSMLENGTFGVITMWHVLEHVHDLHGYVKKLADLLNDNGILVIAVPNYQSTDAAKYGEYWAAYDVPRHLYHFSPKSMMVLMEAYGLTISKHMPMWYDSFYVSMLSSKYQKGKTKLVSSVINGIRSNARALGDVKKCSSIIYIIKARPFID
jgi:2-polyprenyl-3-methyl-5-hydroxy-6-metoxy-1,4-benzoquinol methylase